MIERLEGEVVERGHLWVLLKVGPVVFRVWTVPRDLPPAGSRASFWTHLVMGDAPALYGFQSLPERDLFLRLLKIPGIGPQTALRILAESTLEELHQAVASGDTRFFSRIPGVGKKRALRILAELKEDLTLPAQVPSSVLEALIALGLSPREAREALHTALREHPETDEETLLRRALELRSPP